MKDRFTNTFRRETRRTERPVKKQENFNRTSKESMTIGQKAREHVDKAWETV